MQDYGWATEDYNRNKKLNNYEVYYRAGKNTYVAAAINAYYAQLLANGFSVFNPNMDTMNNPRVNYISNLFNYPNGINGRDIETYPSFLRQVVWSYLLTGDAFIEISYDDLEYNGSVFEVINGFKFLNPESIRYYKDTEQYGFVNNDSLRFEPDELIHIYDKPSHRDNKFGESRIDLAALAIRLLFESLKYNADYFERDGLNPNAVLSFDKDMEDDTFIDELSRLSVQAKNKSGRGLLAVKGASFSTPNSSLRDAEYSNLLILARNIILNSFNCPPSLAGIVESANLSANTIDSEMRVFKPHVNAVCQTIECGFNTALKRNGFDEEFHFNPIELHDRLQEAQIAQMELNTGLKTINEVRSELGLDVVDWGWEPLTTTYTEPVSEVDTGDEELDKAFQLIQQTKSQVWSDYLAKSRQFY